MATSNSKKVTNPRKRTKSRAKSTTSKAVSWVQAQGDLKTAGLFLVGMIAGKQVALFVEKQTQKVSGVWGFDLKNPKLLADAGVAVAGLLGTQIAENKDIKIIATGITAGGVINVLKDVTGKDLLAGLGDTFSLGGTSEPIAAIGESAITKLLDQEMAKDSVSGMIEDLDYDDTDLDPKPVKGTDDVVEKSTDFAAGVSGRDDEYSDAEIVAGLDGDDDVEDVNFTA
jgi:hypothetical protein